MVRFIFPKSGHLSQLHSPFFTVNQELPFLWALGCFLSSFLFSLFTSVVLVGRVRFVVFFRLWKRETFDEGKEYVLSNAFK